MFLLNNDLLFRERSGEGVFIVWSRTLVRIFTIVCANHDAVQLILTRPIINYGLNRIFRNTQSGTVNWNSRNNGPDPIFLEETNTGTIK